MTKIDVNLVLNLVREAGDGLVAAYPAACPAVDREGFLADFAAVNDPTSDRLRHGLALAYPEISWSEDEFDLDGDRTAPSGEVWICDPIDGAVQFLNHLPHWAISLVLVRDGSPVLSVVHDPGHGELFHAVAGGGAFLNGAPIRPSVKPRLQDALVAFSHPPFAGNDRATVRRVADSVAAVLPHVLAIRNLGPTALQLAYVAAGRLDAFWELGEDRTNWLSGSLILEEAGAMLSDGRGEPFGWSSTSLVASSPALHRAILEALARVE